MAPSGGWFCRNERVQKYVPQVLSKYVRLLLKAGEIVLSRPQHKVSSPDPEYLVKKRRSKRRVTG